MTEINTSISYDRYFEHKKLWNKRRNWSWAVLVSEVLLIYLLTKVVDRAVFAQADDNLRGFFGVLLFTQFFSLFFASIIFERKADAIDDLIESAATLDSFRKRYAEDTYIGESHPWYPFLRLLGLVFGPILAVFCLSVFFWLLIEAALLLVDVASLYTSWPTSLQVLCALLFTVFVGGAFSKAVKAVLFEEVKTFYGELVPGRLRTSTILVGGLLCIPFGIWLLTDGLYIGATLILTICPCLFLYPIIRFLFFGGKDSVAGVVTTVIAEEVAKAAVSSAIQKKSKRKKS